MTIKSLSKLLHSSGGLNSLPECFELAKLCSVHTINNSKLHLIGSIKTIITLYTYQICAIEHKNIMLLAYHECNNDKCSFEEMEIQLGI